MIPDMDQIPDDDEPRAHDPRPAVIALIVTAVSLLVWLTW